MVVLVQGMDGFNAFYDVQPGSQEAVLERTVEIPLFLELYDWLVEDRATCYVRTWQLYPAAHADVFFDLDILLTTISYQSAHPRSSSSTTHFIAMSAGGILTLPTEMQLAIASFLTPDELGNLALVNQFLFDLLFHLHLEREGIIDSQGAIEVFEDTPRLILTGLTLRQTWLLPNRHISSIRINRHVLGKRTSDHRLYLSIGRLCSSDCSVGEIAVDCTALREGDGRMLSGPVHLDMCEGIAGLLKGVQAAHCGTLKIGARINMNRWRGPDDIADLSTTQSDISFNALSTLCIRTTLLFTSALQHLTMQMLNTPSITTLHMELYISFDSWQCILQRTTLPNLTEVSLHYRDDHLHLDDLMHFLERHTNVRTLRVPDRLAGVGQYYSKTFSTIQNIETGRGLLNRIIKHGVSVHPALNLTIMLTHIQGRYENLDEDFRELRNLYGCEVSLTMQLGGGTHIWLNGATAFRCSADPAIREERPERRATCVKSITVHTPTGNDQCVVQWLALFPSVKKIDIVFSSEITYFDDMERIALADGMREALRVLADDVETRVTIQDSQPRL